MLATVGREQLIPKGAHVMVACSGGPDSVTLLHALWSQRKRLSITLSAASIDHGLRAESADEVKQVEQLARQLGIQCVSTRLGLPSVKGIQDRARVARYQALDRMAMALGADRKATAHTLNDQAETVVQRIVRGSGISGLQSIQYARDDQWIRPLLDVSRAQVEQYIRYHKLPVVQDPSNLDTVYQRIRVRRAILPQLEHEHPNVASHLVKLADEARHVRQSLEYAAALYLNLQSTLHTLNFATLGGMPLLLRAYVLRTWLENETGTRPNRAQIESVLKCVHQGTGASKSRAEIWLKSGWTVMILDGTITIDRSKRRGYR